MYLRTPLQFGCAVVATLISCPPAAANYAFDANLHVDKFGHWLTSDVSHRLIVLAYDDREIMFDGKKVVGPTGGTFRATFRMRVALGSKIRDFANTCDSTMLQFSTLNRRHQWPHRTCQINQ